MMVIFKIPLLPILKEPENTNNFSLQISKIDIYFISRIKMIEAENNKITFSLSCPGSFKEHYYF